MITVTVLIFAAHAEAVGRDRLELALPAGATAADALARVRAAPGGDRLPPRPLLALNARYAAPDAALAAGDELAVIPPVAGG